MGMKGCLLQSICLMILGRLLSLLVEKDGAEWAYGYSPRVQSLVKSVLQGLGLIRNPGNKAIASVSKRLHRFFTNRFLPNTVVDELSNQ
ncbi:hypothetical protein Hanom_Chr10g00956941 [Helianthus anomalus]